MSPDFGFVADATKRHPDELPTRCPRDGLADGGLTGSRRADQREDRSRSAIVGKAAFGAQLAHGQVFGDPLLDVVETRVVRIEHLAGAGRVEPFLRPFRPGHSDEPVEIGADHRRFSIRFAHALEARQLPFGLLLDGFRHARGRNLLPVFLGDRSVVLAELLPNRVHLLAEEVLALLFLRAGFHVLADAFAHAKLRKALLLEFQCERQALDDVERFEQLQLLGVRQIGRVSGRIGQCARLRDGADEREDSAVVAANIEDFRHDRAVLALELARQVCRGRRVVALVRPRRATRRRDRDTRRQARLDGAG